MLAAPAANAADAAGNYAIWGAGARSCHQFRKSADDDAARQPFRHYLMGYLTAYNALAEDTYNAVGSLSLGDALDWITDYCQTNKMDSFDRAVVQLVASHHEQRRRTPGGSSQWGRAPRPQQTPAQPQ